MNSLTQTRTPGKGLRQRVLRNLAYLVAGNGGAALLMLGAVAINSRALSLEKFGVVVLLQSSAMLLAGLFSFATQQPLIKLGAQALELSDKAKFERLLGLSLVADFAGALAAMLTALGVVILLPAWIGLGPGYQLAALIVATSLLFQGFRTSEGIFRLFDRFDLMGFIQVGCAAVQLALAAFLSWRDAPFAAYALMVGCAIALPSLVQLVCALVLLNRRGFRPRLRGFAQDRDQLREFVAYCWTTSGTSACDTFRQNGDSSLVGLLVSVEAAGIYNVAKQVAGILRKGLIIYASVLFPELATLAARKEFDRARRLLFKAAQASIAVTVVAVSLAMAFGQFALSVVFGPSFAAGSWVLVALSAAAGLQLVAGTYSMSVQVFVSPVSLFWCYLGAIAVFAIAIVPAIGAFGSLGAGIAQIAFSVALSAACLLVLERNSLSRAEST